jgi:uncharacterized OsmC-like protein
MSTISVREALAKTTEILAEDPAKAKSAGSAVTAVLEGGVACRIPGPVGELRTDMPPTMGGRTSTPSPGWLLQTALAFCTATVVAMHATQLGISLDLLEVSMSGE